MIDGSRLVAIQSDPTCAADWAARIRFAYSNTLGSIIAVGRELTAAKGALPHGAFEKMVRGDLPFSEATARKFMAIAAHEALADEILWPALPAAWTLLYEFAHRLTPAQVRQFIAERVIRPEMSAADFGAVLVRLDFEKLRDAAAPVEVLPARRPASVRSFHSERNDTPPIEGTAEVVTIEPLRPIAPIATPEPAPDPRYAVALAFLLSIPKGERAGVVLSLIRDAGLSLDDLRA